MKITALELANVKRIKALRLEPTSSGLTIIGGKNAQGKSSVLDAVAYAFGGENCRPTNLKREGAIGDTIIHIETDDGFIIERKGKNSALTVIDPQGKKEGQKILDQMISRIAIDLPRFLNANGKEKANILLGILGIGEELAKLDSAEKSKYDSRTLVGREADQKEKAAKDLPWYEDAPEEPVSVAELLAQHKEVLARNARRTDLINSLEAAKAKEGRLYENVQSLKERLEQAQADLARATEEYQLAQEAAAGVGEAESTELIEKQIADFEEINRKIQANVERNRRLADAELLREQYSALTDEIEAIRKERLALLENANLPYPGLAIENSELVLNGKAWDCMSGAEQLIVGCSIAARLNPKAKFVLLDKLEQLDIETLANFGKWLEERDLQCLATRVSTGSECALIIEDGEAVAPSGAKSAAPVVAQPPVDDDDEY